MRYGPLPPMEDRPIRSKMMGHKGPLRFSLRIGEIQRVDYELMTCDIHWLQGAGPPAREVPLTSPYWSRRGFIGAMPEEGSVVLCGFSAAHEDQSLQPYILTYLPNGFLTALRYDPFGVAERNAEEIDTPIDVLQRELDGVYGPTRHKMRKIYPGDLYIASDKGSEILLDRGIQMLDTTGIEFSLRADTRSMVASTMDYFGYTSAGRKHSGRVIRSGLLLPSDILRSQGTPFFDDMIRAGLIFEDGSFPEDVNALPYTVLENGELQGLVTENLAAVEDDPRIYTEDRLEIQEFTQNELPLSGDVDVDDIQGQWNPFIERVIGTVVGNDPYSLRGRSSYGKLLRPVVFNSPTDSEGSPRLEVVRNHPEENEKSLVAAYLYRMARPDGLGELFVSHDKEGHVFLSIPASTSKASNLGAGRSLEADLKGSAKVVLGANKNTRSSLDLTTSGGMSWNIGTLSTNNRSIDLQTKGGIAIKSGQDRDGASMSAEMSGDVGIAVEGSYGIATSEDHITKVGGKQEISNSGLDISVGLGDANINVLSNYTENIQGAYGTNIGQGRTTTIVSAGTGTDADTLRILSGNRQTTFATPATDTINFAVSGTRTVQSAGSLTHTWQAGATGSFSFQSPNGTYSVTLGNGALNFTAATASVNTTASIQIQSPSISIVGSVALGQASASLAAVGGVPGPSPYIDPLSGLPATGNPLVRVV
jgi:hypothetical protein